LWNGKVVPCAAHGVALIGYEGAIGEIADQRFVDRGAVEVELLDILGERQLGDGELVLPRAGLLLGYLGREQITDDPGRLVRASVQKAAPEFSGTSGDRRRSLAGSWMPPSSAIQGPTLRAEVRRQHSLLLSGRRPFSRKNIVVVRTSRT
jgi:hypothetical protein